MHLIILHFATLNQRRLFRQCVEGHIGHLLPNLRQFLAEYVEKVGRGQERLEEIAMAKQPAALGRVHHDALGIDHDRELHRHDDPHRDRDMSE